MSTTVYIFSQRRRARDSCLISLDSILFWYSADRSKGQQRANAHVENENKSETMHQKNQIKSKRKVPSRVRTTKHGGFLFSTEWCATREYLMTFSESIEHLLPVLHFLVCVMYQWVTSKKGATIFEAKYIVRIILNAIFFKNPLRLERIARSTGGAKHEMLDVHLVTSSTRIL